MSTNARRIRTGLALAALKPCCLCDNPSIAVTAVFIPPVGKQIVFYSLCASCFRRDDKTDLIEAGLRRRDAA